MIQVQNGNFRRLLPDVLDAIREATFVAIDTEFSALYLHDEHRPSMLDSAAKRYEKMRTTVGHVLPLQVGVAIFKFEPDANAYRARTYTFYVCPKPMAGVNHRMHLQADSVHFLACHDFDFNALFRHGVTFLNDRQEKHVRDALQRGWAHVGYEENMIGDVLAKVKTWHATDAKTITIHGLRQRWHNDPELLYAVQKTLRDAFPGVLWTHVTDTGDLTCSKVEAEEYEAMNRHWSLIDETLSDLLGFTHVYRALLSCRKPIIGHNMLMDLMLIENAFGDELPNSYAQFKRLLARKLPQLYDTKTISFHLGRIIPRESLWTNNILSTLYHYFKVGDGRKLVFNVPVISNVSDPDGADLERPHNAGWDAYCTGFIFVRMAHYMAAKGKGESLRDVMSVEHFANVSQWKNQLNLIRAAIPHLVLDGDDPRSKRPPLLVAESRHGPLEVDNVMQNLSRYGYVEVKKLDDRRALVAISTWTDAKRIMSSNGHAEFSVRKYNVMRHGRYTTHFILGLTTVTCFLLLRYYLGNAKI